MGKLQDAMEECERDTARLIGAGAARRLAKWRQYQGSDGALVEYVQRLIRGTKNGNGFDLERQKGLSLERIVIDRCPELFTDADKAQAAATLGLSGPGKPTDAAGL